MPRFHTVDAYADGAARGNPGPSGCGALLIDPSTGNTLTSDSRYVGDYATNNVAEYHGLMLALELAHRLQVAHVNVYMDSNLVVQQMLGNFKVKSANLRELHQLCIKLCKGLRVTMTHVPREENRDADQLANRAIDQHSY